MRVTLYSFEFCTSNVGVWDRDWHLTHADAVAARKARCDEVAADPESVCDMDGTYGDVGEVHTVDVELTSAGLLEFARDYAVDRGAC
jgi:hypothetical protein